MTGWRAGLVIVAVLASTLFGAEELIPVYKTAPITIDGDLDKPVWKQATAIPIVYEMFTNRDEPNPDATGKYMVAWDEHYLYIAYDWTSTQRPKAGVWDDTRGPKENKHRVVRLTDEKGQFDCFEFFLAINDDEHQFWEIQHNDQNAMGDYLCLKPRGKNDPIRNFMENPNQPVVWLWPYFIQDDGEYKISMAVHEKIKKDGDKEIYTGYSAELRLPLKGLGADLDKRTKTGYQLEGLTFRLFGAESRSGGRKPSYFQSIPSVHNGWFHDAVPKGQHFTFAAAKEEKPEPKK